MTTPNESQTRVVKPWAERVSLPTLVFSESACALVAMSTVVPFVTIVDKSIFLNASGREPMFTCMANQVRQALSSPAKFVSQPAFRWIFAVYGTTYVAANNFESLYHRFRPQKDAALAKFVATSGANVPMSLLKDRAFAKAFGAVDKPMTNPPSATLGLFFLRDCITIAASFTLVSHFIHFIYFIYSC